MLEAETTRKKRNLVCVAGQVPQALANDMMLRASAPATDIQKDSTRTESFGRNARTCANLVETAVEVGF
jgi:hypothetical protein